MPYLVASILSVVTAMVILLTRYESDDSRIKSEIENLKVMFTIVDGFVNTYIQTIDDDLEDINFREFNDIGILMTTSVVTGTGMASTMSLPNNDVVWQLIPNKNEEDSYKLLVNMTASSGLMSKVAFSESFAGREFCEKSLFGTLESTVNKFDTDDFIDDSGTKTDGIFACTVFK